MGRPRSRREPVDANLTSRLPRHGDLARPPRFGTAAALRCVPATRCCAASKLSNAVPNALSASALAGPCRCQTAAIAGPGWAFPSAKDKRLAEAIIHHSQVGLRDDYRRMRALEPAISATHRRQAVEQALLFFALEPTRSDAWFR